MKIYADKLQYFLNSHPHQNIFLLEAILTDHKLLSLHQLSIHDFLSSLEYWVFLTAGAKEVIEDPLLKKISEVLKIPVEAFQNFDEEQAVNIISNTVNNNDHASGIVPPENRTVSLVEKKQLNLQYVTAKKIQFRIQI